MSFYPRLNETLQDKIAPNRINAEIRRELLTRFSDKYAESKAPGSVKTKQRGQITAQDLANDIMLIVKDDHPEWKISEPEIRLAKKPEGLSGTFLTIFFTINGQQEKFVLRGEQAEQATGTPTNVKECLVCYFFESKKKYSPFKKTGKEDEKRKNYTYLLTQLISDIKKNGIPGCHDKDIAEVSNFLEYEIGKYNKELANAIFNAMSIGNFLRTTQFVNWNVNRESLFDEIKNKIGREILGFPKPDKWNPMDIILVKPGSINEIHKRILEAEKEENSDLQLGKINSLFVEKLDSKNPESLILAISLKEQSAQAGKAKGFIKKLSPKFGETYNLSPEERGWFDENEKLSKKIIEYRKSVKAIIDKRLDEFSYDIEKGSINDYDIKKEPLKKYAALKMLLYILSAAQNDKNIFTGIVKYGLSLEKNPTYFKLKGNIEGDEEKVGSDLEKFPASSGIQLYNPKNKDFDGKIHIRDSNDNMGVYAEYYIVFGGIIYFARVSIRSNQSGRATQVTVELNRWKELENLNENKNTFYPRLFEKFKEQSDPVKDMGIGLSEEETLLYNAVKLFGNQRIFWELSEEEKRNMRGRVPKYDLNRSLPMSLNDWAQLKKEMGWQRVPKRYIEKVNDPYSPWAGDAFKQLKYTQIFSDVYGDDWYYDDVDLVQGDRTIVNLFLHPGITFKELVKKVQTSKELKIRTKK